MIPVKEFKCTNQFAYNDLLTLLKEDQYPFLEIDIPYISGISSESNDSVLLKSVSFFVAGASKKYDINCRIKKSGNNSQILNGMTRLKLTDLGLEPPVRLFGIVKVNDEIIIDFAFCLKY